MSHHGIPLCSIFEHVHLDDAVIIVVEIRERPRDPESKVFGVDVARLFLKDVVHGPSHQGGPLVH